MSKLLITGGEGFIGKSLCKKLKVKNYILSITSRKSRSRNLDGITIFNVGEIDDKTKWTKALDKVDFVIHCAARTHMMKKSDRNSLSFYRNVNVHGTINLAKQAAVNGVKRLIFLSSVKVNGERTSKFSSFNNHNIPNPEDAYGISKWEAEQALWKISKETGLEVVIIRAPLVYGKGVKGNLANLMRLINSGIPLPLNSIKNQRSLIGIDNLVDILIRCIGHQDSAGKTFLVSDGVDLSTPDLIRRIAHAMKVSVRLFSFPLVLLKFMGFILRKKNEIDRLLGSLRVDSNYTKKILNWKPPVSVDEGIRRMVSDK